MGIGNTNQYAEITSKRKGTETIGKLQNRVCSQAPLTYM